MADKITILGDEVMLRPKKDYTMLCFSNQQEYQASDGMNYLRRKRAVVR
ncbi:MAG: hypothetical protein WBE68_11380 [Candidatus Nitrosopolaris sp.]